MAGKPLAEKAATWQRPLDPERDDQAAALNPLPEREVADEDLHVERKDLGPDSVTFIAAGDTIPPSWPPFPGGQLAAALASAAGSR